MEVKLTLDGKEIGTMQSISMEQVREVSDEFTDAPQQNNKTSEEEKTS